MRLPLIADDGGGATMVAWSVYPATFDRAVWALVVHGTVQANGTFPSAVDSETAQLFVLGTTFHLFQPGDAIYRFDGEDWLRIAFDARRIEISGTRVLGIRTGTFGGVTATVYDGTTAGTPQEISSHELGDVAADGAGGFGVVTSQTSGTSATLRFVTYDGSAWSGEDTIGTQGTATSIHSIALAYDGTTWGIAVDMLLGSPAFWGLSSGTWSSVPPGLTDYVAFAGNNGTFAISSIGGEVAIFDGDSWSTTDLFTFSSADGHLFAFEDGYLYLNYRRSSGTLSSVFYDGAAWSVPTLAGNGSPASVSIEGSRVAFDHGFNRVAIHEDGAWALASAGGTGGDRLAVAISGSDVVAAVPTPGAMNLRRYTGGEWEDLLPLPTYPTSGPVVSGVMARAGNGHRLAVWGQWDDGAIEAFASAYDGCSWSAAAAIPLDDPTFASVAAAGSTFVIAGSGTVYRWTDAGLSPPTSLGNVDIRVASDGSSFVAVWSTGGQLYASTSDDGQTWTPEEEVEPSATALGLVGGGGGVIAWYAAGPSQAKARVWTEGAWSAEFTLDAISGGSSGQCKAAVADSSALIVCNGSSQMTAGLFADGAWSELPVGSPVYFTLASDGVDYRLDYGVPLTSRILRAGAWSDPIAGTSAVAGVLGTAGRAGAWSTITTDGMNRYAIARARGAAPYAAPSVLLSSPIAMYVSTQPWTAQAGVTDAVLVHEGATHAGISVLSVALDLWGRRGRSRADARGEARVSGIRARRYGDARGALDRLDGVEHPGPARRRAAGAGTDGARRRARALEPGGAASTRTSTG